MTPPSRSTGSLNWTRDEQIAVPSADRERRMAVRYHDWQRIKRSLDRISHPLPKLEVVFSFLFGIAATSGFSMVAAQAAQTSSPWVMPLYIAIFVFTSAFGVVFLWLDRKLGRTQSSSIQEIRDDMDSVERMFGGGI